MDNENVEKIEKWLKKIIQTWHPDIANLFVFNTLATFKTEAVITPGEAAYIMDRLIEDNDKIKKEFWK